MNKHIAFLLLAMVLLTVGCARQQPVWLDEPPTGADAEARMLPVASGITQGEFGEMLLRGGGLPPFWEGFGGGYLWTEEETGSSREGGEIHLLFGTDIGPPFFIRLNAVFLDSIGNDDSFAGIGIGGGLYFPYYVSPYVGIEAMLGYADADSELVAALVPEIGVKFWIPRDWGGDVVPDYLSLDLGARYFLSTHGRDDDFWLFDVSVTWVLGLFAGY